MSDDSDARWLIEYRSAALDEPSASLDRAILDLAHHRAVRARTTRRGIALCALLLVVAALVTAPHRPRGRQATQPLVRTGYGLQEGATRDYLLTVSVVPPGAIDWR